MAKTKQCHCNRIKLNPCWDDERLYQEGRKIVGSMIQIITYKEFLPLIFGEDGYSTFIRSYPGYSPNTDVTIPNSFATAAFRFGHSLIRPEFTRLNKDNKPLDIGALSLRNSFFNPLQYFISGGTDPILCGPMQDRSKEVDKFLTMVLTEQLFAPTSTGLGQDLAIYNVVVSMYNHPIGAFRNTVITFMKFHRDFTAKVLKGD